MRYKVYDTINKKYITDDQDLILKPDGRIARNEYGDEIGIEGCVVLFYFTDSDRVYVDEDGGVHEDGRGSHAYGTNNERSINLNIDGSVSDLLNEYYKMGLHDGFHRAIKAHKTGE